MRFGIHLGQQHLPGESAFERFKEHVEQVRLLRDLGFDSIWAGQHYLAYPLQFLQTIPLLARLSAEAGDMFVGTDIVILTVQNPIDIAEQIATLDIMTGGRVIFGVGLGYRDVEFDVFGVERKERVSRFEEILTIVRRLWTEDSVTFEGKHFQLRGVQESLKPIQKPHPPIWIGATNDTAIRRAARMGDTWILTTHASFPTLARQLEIYKAALKDAGKPFPKELARVPELYVAESDEAAFRECREYIVTKYKAYVAWGQERDVPEGGAPRRAVRGAGAGSVPHRRARANHPGDRARAPRAWHQSLAVPGAVAGDAAETGPEDDAHPRGAGPAVLPQALPEGVRMRR